MIFRGNSQTQVANHFGISQPRVARITRTDLFIEETAKLQQAEQIKKLEQSQLLVQAQFEKQKCIDEFESWLKQSREMSSVNAASYAKIMKAVNVAIETANADPDNPKSIAKFKVIPNLVRSALALQEQNATDLNRRLGIDDIVKRFNQGEF